MLAATPVWAEPADRVTEPVDATKVQPLPNHVPAWANANNKVGPVPSDSMLDQLTMVLSRSPQQQRELDGLLSEQQNPASANYHHWLTPSQMGERFGVSIQDVETVAAWLRSQGLHVSSIPPSRMFISFHGAAADVGRAFQTQVNYYQVNGAQKMSVSSPPMIPQALVTVVNAVRGLYTIDDKPLHKAGEARSASPQVTAGNNHYLAPADFATIYDLPGSLTGAGVTIGIVGRSRTNFADFANFRGLTNSTFPNPVEIVPTAYGGLDPGPALTSPPAAGGSDEDQLEATLDVLRAGSVAPGANLLLVIATQPSGGLGADAQYLVETEPLPAQVMNISFGLCESAAGPSNVSFWDTLFQQAAGEGISVIVSSGDSGASGCDLSFRAPPASPSPNSPNYICSSSYATCVGGTEFNDSGDPGLYWSPSNGAGLASVLGYIPEGAWNQPLNLTSATQVASSGGGVSSIIATPGWQAGTGVPAARTGRYTPDLAFSASGHDGYFACYAAGSGSCVPNSQGYFQFEYFAGTSAAAPGMAGITALLDQHQGQAAGNLNPRLYQMAQSAPNAFHDVTVATSGVTACSANTPSMCNNSIPGPTTLSGGQPGYLVTSGYDQVTGLGSLDASVFVQNFFSPQPAALQFVKMAPCRIADTRNAPGPFGGPGLAFASSRDFDIPQSGCQIPSNAVAYSLNVTVVPEHGLGYLTIWPSGQAKPVASTLNSDGRVKANAAITAAGTNGSVSVYASDPTQLVLDIDGYFVPSGTASALAFYPVTPCRIADTRNPAGPLGGPVLAANAIRDLPVRTSNCGLPPDAQAYSLNVTVVPRGPLGYMTLWASDQAKPVASTLNASTGTYTANAAIVPAASDGDISVYASSSTDLVLDVDGYFAPPASGGLSLYITTPCRVLDTRLSSGQFAESLRVPVAFSACVPSPSAQAYVLNATVVPPGFMGFLSLWPDGETRPITSTLNAIDGAVTSNMAIVPTSNGNIEAFSTNPTQLILDLSGYFAP